MSTELIDSLPAGCSPRITRLREAARARAVAPHDDNARFFAEKRRVYDACPELPHPLRVAKATAAALEHLPVYLLPESQLVGMVYHLGEWVSVEDPSDWYAPNAPRARELFPADAELCELEILSGGAFQGHVSWWWPWVLEKGILGLLAETQARLATAADETARTFYQGVLTMLTAVVGWNQRHAIALEEAGCGADTAERARLAGLLEIVRRVPTQPARTFREAVQSWYFQHLCVMRENPFGGNGPGRLDYFLWPYLERDLAARAITLQEAYELIQELFILIDERILEADGWVETIVTGGCHPDGTPAVNPLSYLMVEAFIALDLVHPAVYMRIPEHPPTAWVELAARYLREGKNRAQIISDRTMLAAMTRAGMPFADAAHYTCGGCMEIHPHGMNSDLLFTGTHNLMKTLELTLTGGACLKTGRWMTHAALPALPDYADFEELFQTLVEEIRRETRLWVERLDFFSARLAETRPMYLLSALMLDCLARGREQHDGGARYHDYGIAALGLPNVADALTAVKIAVFDDRRCTAEELLAALRDNFAGHDALRAYLKSLPTYGQQHPEADAMANRILVETCRAYADAKTRWGGQLKPMLFTFVWAPMMGATLGATAYGDLAGALIAQGMTPRNSAMTDGLTAAIGSHAALSLDHVSGGATSMWDLDAQWASQPVVRALLDSFLALGGMFFQGNTTDVRDLLAARERPEEYPNLIVRVGGFSSRFVILSPELQEEIIGRVRHRG
jgi:formate C-acetyltransferase